MRKIIMASNNEGKIKEAQKILKEYKIITMSELNINVDVEEDKETFAENAVLKAETISKIANGMLCIADDSGIEVEYLNGFPGVKTKRWFDGTDRQRNLALIEKLNNIPKENRKVKFTTAIAVSNGKDTIVVTDFMEGYISNEPRGDNGFGFDEIFELEDGRTLAELNQEEKNSISSRKKALEKMSLELKKYEL